MEAEADALTKLPLPVVVVGAAAGGERSCATATVTYVSLSPMLVAVPLARASKTLQLLGAAGTFTISILAATQADVAVLAGSAAEDKFDDAAFEVGAAGVPVVSSAAAVLWCEVEQTLETPASSLVVGRVREARIGHDDPLVRFDRRYRSLGAVVEVASEAAYPL